MTTGRINQVTANGCRVHFANPRKHIEENVERLAST